MANKKQGRTFTTLPSAIIGDTSLTALDLRILAVIALHDGMSGVKGSGGGCFARNDTLAALARTDASNFSKSLTKLIRAGYVSREPQMMDKRRWTLRVQYPDDDGWRIDQVSSIEMVGDPTNKPRIVVGETAAKIAKVVGHDEVRNGGFSKKNGRHYIPLNGKLNLDESIRITLPKRRAAECEKAFRPSIVSVEDERGGQSLRALMSPAFDTLDCPGQVGQIEHAFASLDHNTQRVDNQERQEIASLLYAIFECNAGRSFGQQAYRLYTAMSGAR